MLKHLKERMADASTYGWEPVRAYHGVWLQQLENGRDEWHDIELKLEFRHVLVWNSARTTTSRSQPSDAPQKTATSRKNQNKDTNPNPVPDSLGTKACALFPRAWSPVQQGKVWGSGRPPLRPPLLCLLPPRSKVCLPTSGIGLHEKNLRPNSNKLVGDGVMTKINLDMSEN